MSNQKIEQSKSESDESNIFLSENNKPQAASYAFYGSKLFVKCFGWFIFITFINIVLASAFVYFYHYRPAKEKFDRISSGILQNNGQLMMETYEKQGSLSFIRFRGPGNFWLFDEKLNKIFDGVNKDYMDFIPPNKPISENDRLKPSVFNPPPPIRGRNPDFNRTNEPYKDFRPDDIEHFGPKPPPLPKEDKEKITIEVKAIQNQLSREKYMKLYKANESKILDFAKTLLNSKETNTLKIDDENFLGCLLISDTNKKYVAIIHVPKEIPEQRKEIFINQAKNMLPFFIIVCAILCFLMARYLAKPIVELQEASQKFANGDFSHKITNEAMARYDEIGDLASDFNNMASRIEALINSQKRLFNDISHELRSPLARMQVGIELLQMKVPESEKSLVERLDKDVNRMNALIEEVLQFYKLENKQISGPTEEVDLGKALENVCADAEFEGKNKHRGVSLEIKQTCLIKGNSILIERAFENIIRNSLRFTPENTVVDVSLEKVEKKAIIKIGDSGPGVPEDQLEKIFAPFYCIKADRNPQSGGIGLGLCIALKAVQIHNGNIKMSNRPEGGLLATIELPLG